VVDAIEDQVHANGIKFAEYSGRTLAKSMRKAMVLYGEKKLLRHYQQNAMKVDFSWDRMVESYLQVYRRG
jgi:glycogen synthase